MLEGAIYPVMVSEDNRRDLRLRNGSIAGRYMQYTRQMCIETIEESSNSNTIGGEDREVQIDESKFAKRKYHRGSRVGDKRWVFAGRHSFGRTIQNTTKGIHNDEEFRS